MNEKGSNDAINGTEFRIPLKKKRRKKSKKSIRKLSSANMRLRKCDGTERGWGMA